MALSRKRDQCNRHAIAWNQSRLDGSVSLAYARGSDQLLPAAPDVGNVGRSKRTGVRILGTLRIRPRLLSRLLPGLLPRRGPQLAGRRSTRAGRIRIRNLLHLGGIENELPLLVLR